jgi:hypothetical protein
MSKELSNSKLKEWAFERFEISKDEPMKIIVKASCKGVLKMEMIVNITMRNFLKFDEILLASKEFDQIVEIFEHFVIVCEFTHLGVWVSAGGRTQSEAINFCPKKGNYDVKAKDKSYRRARGSSGKDGTKALHR